MRISWAGKLAHLIVALVAVVTAASQSSYSSPFDFLAPELVDSGLAPAAKQTQQQQQDASSSLSSNAFAAFDFAFNTQNLSQILLKRFQHIFDGGESSISEAKLPAVATTTTTSIIAGAGGADKDRLLALSADTQPPRQAAGAELEQQVAYANNTVSASDDQALEDRKHELLGLVRDELESRNYFRVLDRIFSRIELPDVYKTPPRSRGGLCALHLGCFDEVPNIPSLLKRANISSIFTIYTNKNGHYSAQKIMFEPKIHYQLEDANLTENNVRDSFVDSHQQRQQQQQHQQQQQQQQVQNLRHQQQQQLAGAPCQVGRQRSSRCQTASSWQASVKIKRVQEYPYDLAALERCGFDSGLTTRIIIGGYFAKETEEWIDELVRQWQLLEPSNIIKVSWPDANRGLYHSAAYNSRIVSRQLTLFVHYLDQMFSIDLERFHLVGHSLGAHIAGSVGADFEGRIARITGLDPAGPIFVDLNASMRLDPSDAKFVDVIHTNGGPITKGALGLSLPSGHVDYYCNGGSVQPGCLVSSVSKSIMDPVERVACNHRRSYRYFIEIIKLTVSEKAGASYAQAGQTPDGLDLSADEQNLSYRQAVAQPQQLRASNRPRAFLFEAKLDDLMKLFQPEILLVSSSLMRREMSLASQMDELVPLNRRIEFHELKSNFPVGKRGLYFVRTRSESPFFGKQYAVTIRSDTLVKRKIALALRIEHTMVPEVEVDEISQVLTLTFVPNEPLQLNASEPSKLPRLWLSWKYRSFSLLSSQQNELYLSALELVELDSDHLEQDPSLGLPGVRYTLGAALNESQPTTAASLALGLQPFEQTRRQLLSATGGGFVLTRNRWHRFEGRPLTMQAA